MPMRTKLKVRAEAFIGMQMPDQGAARSMFLSGPDARNEPRPGSDPAPPASLFPIFLSHPLFPRRVRQET